MTRFQETARELILFPGDSYGSTHSRLSLISSHLGLLEKAPIVLIGSIGFMFHSAAYRCALRSQRVSYCPLDQLELQNSFRRIGI